MPKIVRLILTIAIAALVAGLIAWAEPQAKSDAKAGKLLYDKKCASCHGPNGEGKPALAKALKVELRDLGAKDVQAKDDEQLRKDTVEGVGKMKAVTGLKEQEVADLVAFMRSLKKK